MPVLFGSRITVSTFLGNASVVTEDTDVLEAIEIPHVLAQVLEQSPCMETGWVRVRLAQRRVADHDNAEPLVHQGVCFPWLQERVRWQLIAACEHVAVGLLQEPHGTEQPYSSRGQRSAQTLVRGELRQAGLWQPPGELAIVPLREVHTPLAVRDEAVAVLLPGDPLARIGAAVGPLKSTIGVLLTTQEVAPVLPAVRPLHVAYGAQLVPAPLARVGDAAGPPEGALPFDVVALKLPLEGVPSDPRDLAVAVPALAEELAFVGGSVLELFHAMPELGAAAALAAQHKAFQAHIRRLALCALHELDGVAIGFLAIATVLGAHPP
mmetsp:Transcript_48782/g.110511  ORF Transcript_48782/g.110511 Transcript_48782/m.110511 type:complete len:323 (+) Transcript_48782:805-1773(+)